MRDFIDNSLMGKLDVLEETGRDMGMCVVVLVETFVFKWNLELGNRDTPSIFEQVYNFIYLSTVKSTLR